MLNEEWDRLQVQRMGATVLSRRHNATSRGGQGGGASPKAKAKAAAKASAKEGRQKDVLAKLVASVAGGVA